VYCRPVHQFIQSHAEAFNPLSITFYDRYTSKAPCGSALIKGTEDTPHFSIKRLDFVKSNSWAMKCDCEMFCIRTITRGDHYRPISKLLDL